MLVGHSMGGAIVRRYLATRPAAAGVLLASIPPAGAIPATLRPATRHPLLLLLLLLLPTSAGFSTTFFPMAHDVMLEDGWQAVADHILRWLAVRDSQLVSTQE